MATRAISKSNKTGTSYSIPSSNVSGRTVGTMDKSNNSSIIALVAAATVVIAIFISAPIMLGMYMDTSKNNYVVESKSKQVDIKIEKLDDMIKYNEKLLKELEKNKKE
jgi:hypothetical protein